MLEVPDLCVNVPLRDVDCDISALCTAAYCDISALCTAASTLSDSWLHAQ